MFIEFFSNWSFTLWRGRRNCFQWNSYCNKGSWKPHTEHNVCHMHISARSLWFIGRFSIDFRGKRIQLQKLPSSPWLKELSKRADGSEFQAMNHCQGISSSRLEQEEPAVLSGQYFYYDWCQSRPCPCCWDQTCC